MDKFSTTSDTLDQADEEILTPTVSDEAIEAAAATSQLPFENTIPMHPTVKSPWAPVCLNCF